MGQDGLAGNAFSSCVILQSLGEKRETVGGIQEQTADFPGCSRDA